MLHQNGNIHSSEEFVRILSVNLIILYTTDRLLSLFTQACNCLGKPEVGLAEPFQKVGVQKILQVSSRFKRRRLYEVFDSQEKSLVSDHLRWNNDEKIPSTEKKDSNDNLCY